MHRYIPISILAETIVVLGFSTSVPREFILECKETLDTHLNLITEEVQAELVKLYAILGNKFSKRSIQDLIYKQLL